MLKIHTKAKYQLLINRRESTDLKYLNDDSNPFIEYSSDMIFMKTLKNGIQIKSKKFWSYLMIWISENTWNALN